MKLHFEPDLDYQLDAIEAVCALFRGQEACRTEFTVTLPHPETSGQRNGRGGKPAHSALRAACAGVKIPAAAGARGEVAP